MPPDKTLKGILNVVTLTEQNIRKINSNVEKIAETAEKVSKVAGGMTAGKTKEKDSIVVKKLDEIISILKGTHKDIKSTEIADITKIGKGISSISSGLLRFALVPRPVRTSFINFIDNLYEIFEKRDPERVKSGAESLKTISETLSSFSRGLAFVGIVAAATLPLQPIIILTLYSYGRIFEYMGVRHDRITEGARSFERMGRSMMMVAGGFAMLGLTFAAISALMPGEGGVLKAIGGMALSLVAFAGAMMLFALPPVERGIDSLQRVGRGFIFLAGGLAILGITFAAIGALMGGKSILHGVLGTVSAIAAIGLTFALLGLAEIPIRRGVRAIQGIGLGFLILSGGIGIMALSFALSAKLFGVKPIELGVSIALSVAGIGLSFMLMGQISPNILKGALAVGLIGVSLIVLGFSVGKMFDNLPGETTSERFKSLGVLGTAVVGLGLAYVGIGVPVVAGMITAGSAAMIAVGGSLIVLSIGFKKFYDSLPTEDPKEMLEILGTMGITIGGLGLAFAPIGAVSPLVLLGASSMIAVGGALSSLGGGLGTYEEKVGFDTRFDNMRNEITEISNVFRKLGGPITTARVTLASGTVFTIGKALSSLAGGVGDWARLNNIRMIKGYDEHGNPIYGSEVLGVQTAIENIKEVLGGGDDEYNILHPFIELSKEADLGRSPNVLSVLTGINVTRSPFSRGVRIAGNIGKVLSNIAEGVATWGRLDRIPTIVGYDDEGKPEYGETVEMSKAIENMKEVFGGGDDKFNILHPFIELSKEADLDRSPNLISIMTGINLARSPFSRGVRIAGDIGKVLSGVASGVGSYAHLDDIPRIEGYDEHGNPIFNFNKTARLSTAIENIKKVFRLDSGIFKIFSDLGEEIVRSTGDNLLGSFIRNPIGTIFTGGKSSFETGVSSSLGIGKVLSMIGEGMATFASLEKIPIIKRYDENGNPIYDHHEVNVSQVAKNIEIAIDTILGVFEDKEIDFSRRERRSLKALGGIGPMLSGLSESFKTFSDLNNIKQVERFTPDGDPIYSEDTVDVDKIARNVGIALETVLNVFEEKDISFRRRERRSLESLGGVGPMLTGLAGAFETFSSLENVKIIDSIDPETGDVKYKVKTTSVSEIADNIDIALTRILSIFAEKEDGPGDEFVKSIKSLAAIEKPFTKFISAFDKMAISMGTFSENFSKMTPDAIGLYKDWTKSMIAFTQMSPRAFSARLDLVSEAFGASDDEETIPEGATATEHGQQFLGLGADEADLAEEAAFTKKQEDYQTQMMLRLEEIRNSINILNATITDGIDVSGSSIKVSNLDD